MKPIEIDESRAVPVSAERRSRLWLIPQVVLPIVIIALAAFLARWLVASKPEVPQRPPREQVYIVNSVPVARADHRPMIHVFGSVVAGRSVDLRSLVAGEVVSVSDDLRVGARVAKGEELLAIDRFNYEGAVTEARANLAEAEAALSQREALIRVEEADLKRGAEQLELARRDLERARQLVKTGNLSPRSVDERRLILSQREQAIERTRSRIDAEKASAEQQRVALERLRWRLEQARRNLSDTVLKAPFDGVVTDEAVELGRLLNANDVAVSLYDVGRMEVRFALSDFKYGQLLDEGDSLVGRKATVVWYVGDKPLRYEAVVDRVGAEIRPERGGIDVFARLTANPDKAELRPGAFVEVVLPGKLYPDSVALPETSVYGNDHVFAIVDGRLEKRAVSVEAYDEAGVLVRGDFKDGDRVLATRIAEVGEGLRVRGEGEKPAGAAAKAGERGPPPEAAAQ